MKKVIFLLVLFVFGGVEILGQDSQNPPILVFSQNKVKMSDMGKVNKMVDSVFAPILNSFVDEGKLMSWGQLNHAWGDEWNFNLWYTAKDTESFHKFWDEYIKKVVEVHPDALGSTVGYFKEHKDNIYSMRKSYSGK